MHTYVRVALGPLTGSFGPAISTQLLLFHSFPQWILHVFCLTALFFMHALWRRQAESRQHANTSESHSICLYPTHTRTHTHICTHSVGMCTVYINTRLVDFWFLLCLLRSFSLSQLVVYAEDGRDSEVGWAWSWSCSVCLLLHLAAGEANVITMKLTFICIAKLLFTFALPTLRRGNKYICISYAINLRFQLQISRKITI